MESDGDVLLSRLVSSAVGVCASLRTNDGWRLILHFLFFFFFRNHGNNHSPSLALYLLCNLHLASSVQQVMSFGAEEARPYLLWNLRRSFLLLFKLNTFLEYSGFTLSGMLHMHFSNFGANRWLSKFHRSCPCNPCLLLGLVTAIFVSLALYLTVCFF